MAFIEKRAVLAKEQVRAVRTGPWLETWLKDLHFGLRVLRKKPSVAVVSILSLALGIGATTAILSVMYGILLKPFPYVGADRMVALNASSVLGVQPLGLSAVQFQALRRARCVDGASADDDFDMVTSSGDVPEAVEVVTKLLTDGRVVGRCVERWRAEHGFHRRRGARAGDAISGDAG